MRFALICSLLCAVCASKQARAQINIPTVPVGNPGNADDPLTGYGGVDYYYRMGTTEVTNAQYAAFLNEKAKSDPLQLYIPSMTTNPLGGLVRSGVSGSYTYAPKPNMGDKPVNYVTWYSTIRFANWLHNGQGAGDTETGAYTILSATPDPFRGLLINRNPGAKWFLPSEDEWYKAAYHQPAAQGGDIDDYWLYPTASNTAPTVATANSNGDISNPGSKVVNYNSGADWDGQDGNLTTVGSAGPLSTSFYGTVDQGGNVWEWTEGRVGADRRVFRGGSYHSRFGGNVDAPAENFLQSTWRNYYGGPMGQGNPDGFRVATIVPEPSTFALAGLGGLALLVAWYRRGHH